MMISPEWLSIFAGRSSKKLKAAIHLDSAAIPSRLLCNAHLVQR